MESNFFPYNSVHPPQKPSLKTLIIDDEDDMYYLLRNILKQRNIDAVYAGSIRDGLRVLKQDPGISLIFLDNRLPDGLGVQHIRQFKAISDVNIVMMTAYDTSYDQKMAINNGADNFIGKPFTKQTILSIVDQIASSHNTEPGDLMPGPGKP
ncbi:response regulator [Niabella sp. CC-SYL272]|uniref:response regulator n=1 Tax=Niabella agricola TaxID=2891571 RepID=UPI001F1AA88E|nr:response regulator [Niabella agricola]MCF3108325.1 response regulator [Niabella agricola]